MPEEKDEQLIVNYLKGDQESLEILIQRYLKPIYGFIYRLIGNGLEVEDITQQTFVKMWRNLKKFDQKKSFKNWLFAIARNAAVDFFRKKKTIPLSHLENSLADKSNFVQDVEQKDLIKKIKAVLKNLSPACRAVVLLKYENELTFKEIAKQLGEPLNTIKSRYRRAIAVLRKNIIY